MGGEKVKLRTKELNDGKQKNSDGKDLRYLSFLNIQYALDFYTKYFLREQIKFEI